jgi:hypothetical protein
MADYEQLRGSAVLRRSNIISSVYSWCSESNFARNVRRRRDVGRLSLRVFTFVPTDLGAPDRQWSTVGELGIFH